MANSQISFIVKQLIELQEGKLWMGQNFRQKFDQIEDEEAFICPQGTLHSVAQIVAHLTVWKMDALLKLTEGKGKLTDDQAENWPNNESLRSIDWSTIKNDFFASHKNLIELLRNQNDDLLSKTYYDQDFKGEFPLSFMLKGLLQHDAYHLGQIGLIIKMIKQKAISLKQD